MNAMNGTSSKSVREEVLKLIEAKEQLENEIKDLQAILSQNNVGMDDALVDDDGFPLANVDVYQVRHARHLIICKQNDHKALMKLIEKGISEYYNTQPMDISNGHSSHAPSQNIHLPSDIHNEPSIEHVQPFASINVVHEGSPAHSAGIQQSDCIVEFGSINATNFRSIEDIGTLVRYSRGNAINVKLKRGERFVRVQIIPREWNGRGLLGCNVLPL